jgi:hypothetical protein
MISGRDTASLDHAPSLTVPRGRCPLFVSELEI